MNNKALNHDASDQLKQPLTALAKTKTFMWVQSKVENSTDYTHRPLINCINQENHETKLWWS